MAEGGDARCALDDLRLGRLWACKEVVELKYKISSFLTERFAESFRCQALRVKHGFALDRVLGEREGLMRGAGRAAPT